MDKSFLKGLTLLEIMAKRDRDAGVTELAEQLGIGKSNVHRLLQALVFHGFVRRLDATGRYELTTKMWELGTRAFRRLDIRREAAPFMGVLAEETQETVHLSILDGVEVLYVDKIDSSQPVRAYTTVGGRAPAACVATGKAMLAWADEAVLSDAVGQLHPYTAKSITSADELHRQLQQVRANGYAVNTGEWREQVVGVAAPIRDATGSVVGALGISGPAARITEDVMQRVAPRLVELANSISARFGFAPEDK